MMKKFYLLSSTKSKAIITIGMLVALLLVSAHASAQNLTVNSTINATNAVQNTLLGEGVTASGITFAGNQATQIGTFNCNNCGLGISSGVIMASGAVAGAVGPNNSGSFSQGPPNATDGFGDPDLAAISGGASINNAAILRFNFIPTGDSLAFRFVFGSDEYPEYVNSINDVFGFFISGPGITGPYLNNAKNIALIPNTNNPVSINSVNPGMNAAYYNANNGQYNVQPDGFTDVLTARANVICGETYQIKIAIGDASDGGWDSWVFLEAGSFQSNNVEIAYQAPNISPSGDGIYEGCQTAYINFSRPAAQSNIEQQFALTFTGTAINGVDFEEISNLLIFPVGQTTVSLPIVAIADGVQEGNETFTITVQNLGCNAGDPVSIEVVISDLPDIIIDMPDVTINCTELAFIEPQLSGGLGNYVVTWDGGIVSPSLSTYPTVPTSYNFVVTDTCGVSPANGVANVLFVQNPPLLVDIGNDISAQCLDEIVVNSIVSGGFGAYSYHWSSSTGYSSTSENINFYDNDNQTITLTVTDICQVSTTDQVQLVYPPVPVIVDIGADLVATCLDQNLIQSQVSGGIGSYTYLWTLGSNTIGFQPMAVAQTGVTADVTLAVNDQCGNTSSDALTITIPPVNISLDLGPDVVATCLDNTTIIPALANGIGTYSYVWTNNGEAVTTAPQYSVQTGITRNIGLTVTDQCGNTANDQKLITIPAAPVALSTFPSDTIICLGTWATLGAQASGGVGNLTYTWVGTTYTTASQAIAMESPPSNTTYIVNVSDQCGNTNSGQMTVRVRELFPQFDSEYISDTEIRLEDLTPDAAYTVWTFGDGSTSEENELVFNFLGAPAWTATLTAYSIEGCSKSITQEFTAIGELFVPNCFTPDNDGVNDMFFVVGHDLRYFELTIFNRFGEVVFKTFDVNEPWDGSHQGSDHFVPNGIYNYQLVAIGKRENTIHNKGAITIIR